MEQLDQIIKFLSENPLIPIIGLTIILVILRLMGLSKAGVTWLFIVTFVITGLIAASRYN
ncbi:MAG: hypothetical protein O3A84_02865 [Proteobacteria bacterium]|nr:hypothetical protein [Pseudomonadota bacterium]